MYHVTSKLFRSAGLVAMITSLSLAVGASSACAADSAPPTDAASVGKTVLVTGANRGLGLEFARQYAAAGWQVIGTARDPESAAELKALDVRVMQLDVADPVSVAALSEGLGDQSVDLLINNAGIMDRNGSLADADFATVERILAVNTIGPMRVTRALLPHLRRGETRQIVNITSGLGSIENNVSGGFYGYRESKAALNMFTRSLAADLKSDGFTCIAMSPGWVQTDMGGPNANLTPEESIAGMRKVIDGLTPADSGTMWSWDSSSLAW